MSRVISDQFTCDPKGEIADSLGVRRDLQKVGQLQDSEEVPRKMKKLSSTWKVFY